MKTETIRRSTINQIGFTSQVYQHEDVQQSGCQKGQDGDNLYVASIYRALEEFFKEVSKGNSRPEEVFKEKAKAAKELFLDDMKKLMTKSW